MRKPYTRQTVNLGWRTYSENYKVTCEECNTKLTRTVSSGCNYSANQEYITELRNVLVAEAESLSRIPTTCTKCLKSRLDGQYEHDPIDPEVLDLLTNTHRQYKAIEKDLKDQCYNLTQIYYNRIFLIGNEEWCAKSISYIPWNPIIQVESYRVNKRQPWILTETYKTFDLEKVVFTDETLMDRIKKVSNVE